MIEAFKQVFFGLFWFTLDCAMIWLWISLLAYAVSVVEKHKHD